MDLASGTAAGLPEEIRLTREDEEAGRTVLYFQYPAPPPFCPSASPGPAGPRRGSGR